MSGAAVSDLVLLVTALLLIVIARTLTWPPPRWLYLQPEAERTLRRLAGQFQNDLRRDAAASPRAVKRKKIVKRDIKAEYYMRRQWPGKTEHFVEILRRAAGGITFGVVVLVVAVLALPFLARPLHDVAGTADYAGPPLAALGLVVAATKFLDKPDGLRDALPPAGQQLSGLPPDPPGKDSDPVAKALERYSGRATKAVRKHARSTAARDRRRRDDISEEEIAKAWDRVVIPRLDVPAPLPVKSRRAWIASGVAVLVATASIYLIFVLAIPKLSLGVPWRLVVIAASLLVLYGLMRAIVGVWRHRKALLGKLVRATRKGRALAASLFRIPRRGRDQPIPGNVPRIRPNAGKEGPATAESNSDRDNGVHISRRRRMLGSMPSSDVREMRTIVAPLIDSKSTNDDDLERRNLAVLLLRMYTDLDKSVRRSDESGARSKWTVRVGAAATAAASAVAGTTLVAGSTGTVAIVVGAVTAALGVIGSVVAALKLSTSIAQNESDHAQYLPLLRQLGSYAAVRLFKDDVQAIQAQLDTFATKISAVEAADAAAAAAAITQ